MLATIDALPLDAESIDGSGKTALYLTTRFVFGIA